MSGFPRDPLISRHPARLSAREARREVRRAAGLRRRVPVGHPYGLLPLWIPYALARLVSALVERARPTPTRTALPIVPVARGGSRRAFERRWTERA